MANEGEALAPGYGAMSRIKFGFRAGRAGSLHGPQEFAALDSFEEGEGMRTLSAGGAPGVMPR